MDLVKKILDLSRQQGATCIYTEEPLRGFAPEKLEVVYAGITALCKGGADE